MAAVLGFEPGMAIPKTAALPLGYTPTFWTTFLEANIEGIFSNSLLALQELIKTFFRLSPIPSCKYSVFH